MVSSFISVDEAGVGSHFESTCPEVFFKGMEVVLDVFLYNFGVTGLDHHNYHLRIGH